MPMRGENWRFWFPVLALMAFAVYCAQKLMCAHIDPKVDAPNYKFTQPIRALRGSIYSSYGKAYPFVRSVPCWEYRLDSVALTNGVVRRRKEPPRPREAIVKTIADALKLDYGKVKEMAGNAKNRYQFLKVSADPDAHRTLADSTLVRGVVIEDKQVRQYIHGRRLSHVLGYLNAEQAGTGGIEQRFNREMTGTPGTIQGMRDGRKHELYDKRKVSIDPIAGADVYLTIEPNIQFEAENALKWGLQEYGAGSAWCIVMDSRTGAILAMASQPDFDPQNYRYKPEDAPINRAVNFNFEPGSVMKVITAAAAIEAGFVSPDTVYSTDRTDENYVRLPSDGSHDWVSHPRPMTVREAIVHSANIVIGKLAYDFGPKRLYAALRGFGFGERTGIELPGEQYGILPNPNKKMWDRASWSRAGIGQFVSVTAIQLISAYQAIANDGVRMRPYVVEKVVESNGAELMRHTPEPVGRPISARTARTMREVMLDVASPKGTARRAAIRGYSVAGKTGTAQKQDPGKKGYAPGKYRASFCGIVPATEPRIVVLATLDFDQRTKFHQGGNSAGPVFKRIALAALRYLEVQADRPEELIEFQDDDEFDKIMNERAEKNGIQSDN